MIYTAIHKNYLFYLLCILICFCWPLLLVAQQGLPIDPILEQRDDSNKEQYLFKLNTDGIPIPPESEVRAMAEWEELEAIALAWSATWAGSNQASYDTLLAEITLHARQECNVTILCDNVEAIQQRLEDIVGITDFTLPITCPGDQAGISTINFITVENGAFDERIWIRDYGPHTIYTNDVDIMAFVDWQYDAAFPEADINPSSSLADFYNTLLYVTTQDDYVFRLDGGNFLTDGMGNAFSSKIVTGENQHNNPPAQVISEFMGINTYHYQGLPVLLHHEYSRKHIDMYMKFLDEETILLGEGYPDENNRNSERIEENLEYLKDLKSPFDRPYQIERIIVPPDENGEYPGDQNAQGGCNTANSSCFVNYTNALFINRTILVPTYNNEYDATALAHWQHLMPGYNIVGINSSEIIRSNGAIHCVTKEIGVKEPLWITHPKIREACVIDDEYKVSATIQHVAGIDSAKVFYSVNPIEGFDSVEMVETDDNIFITAIPKHPEGTTIHYYIEAEANNGKKMFRPMPAPQAYWSFEVKSCITNVQNNTKTIPYGISGIFPNPAKNKTRLVLEVPVAPVLTVQLFDMHGRVVSTVYEGRSLGGKRHFDVDLTAIPSGVYVVEMRTKGFKQGKKLFVYD